jgi:hypothetical protein
MKLSRAPWIAIPIAAVLLISCAREGEIGPALRRDYQKAISKQAGPRVAAALKSPQRVQSFYLNPLLGNSRFLPNEQFTEVLGWLGKGGEDNGYAILGVGSDLTTDQQERVANLLLARANFRVFPAGAEYRKMCEFAPRHGLRFIAAEADTVEALVCFECAQLSLQTIDGKEHWGGDFDPMEDELKRLFDQFLPPRR